MRRANSRVPHGTRRRDSGVLRGSLVAGWLFADLFLVLVIVTLPTQPAVPNPKSTSTVTHTPTPTRSATPVASPSRPKPTPSSTHQAGLQLKLYDFYVDVSPADVDNSTTATAATAQLLVDLNKDLAAKHLLGKTAGFVLVFANSVAGAADPINEAVAVANRVIGVLKKNDASTFSKIFGSEGLWGGEGNRFHIQVFFEQ